MAIAKYDKDPGETREEYQRGSPIGDALLRINFQKQRPAILPGFGPDGYLRTAGFSVSMRSLVLQM